MCAIVWAVPGANDMYRPPIAHSSGGARTCRPLPYSIKDTAAREFVVQALVTGVSGLFAPNLDMQGRTHESYALASVPGVSADSLSVVLFWPDWLNDANIVGLVVRGCIWQGGTRSSGGGMLVSGAARQQWNQAIGSVRNLVGVQDAGGVRSLALLYLVFATGQLIASTSDMGMDPEISLLRRPGSGLGISNAVATATYRLEGTWEVTGICRFGYQYQFVAQLGGSGDIVSFFLFKTGE